MKLGIMNKEFGIKQLSNWEIVKFPNSLIPIFLFFICQLLFASISFAIISADAPQDELRRQFIENYKLIVANEMYIADLKKRLKQSQDNPYNKVLQSIANQLSITVDEVRTIWGEAANSIVAVCRSRFPVAVGCTRQYIDQFTRTIVLKELADNARSIRVNIKDLYDYQATIESKRSAALQNQSPSRLYWGELLMDWGLASESVVKQFRDLELSDVALVQLDLMINNLIYNWNLNASIFNPVMNPEINRPIDIDYLKRAIKQIIINLDNLEAQIKNLQKIINETNSITTLQKTLLRGVFDLKIGITKTNRKKLESLLQDEIKLQKIIDAQKVMSIRIMPRPVNP